MRLIAALLTASALLATALAATSEGDAIARVPSTSPSSCTASGPNVCPECHTQIIQDASGAPYTVHCNSIIKSPKTWTLEGNATHRDCMEACDEFNGCWGVSTWSVGHCELAVGNESHVVLRAGFTAFVRGGLIAGVQTTTNSTLTSLTSETTTSSTLQSLTSKMTTTTSTHSSTTECVATAISCPHCDDKVVKDLNGKPYHVYCDNQLFADSDYNLQQWTSPQGCLAACDNVTWCYGSTFWPQGNCQLAKGPGSVFPQEQPGYTAFLPAVAAAAPRPTAPSAFASDTGHSVTSAETNAAFLTATLSSTPSATPEAACSLPNVICPDCDRRTITDGLGQNYRQVKAIMFNK